jgi:hypothetical protein
MVVIFANFPPYDIALHSSLTYGLTDIVIIVLLRETYMWQFIAGIAVGAWCMYKLCNL